MPLWPHQVEAATFIMRQKKGALWHDTGTGKSQSAIEVADQLGANSILVLCPVIATEHWKAQFAKHGKIERQCLIVREPNATLAFTNVIIVPFSMISKYPRLPSRLKGYRYDLLIIDEAHALMNLESNRTASIYAIGFDDRGLQDCAPLTVLLSATLSPNGRPNELYPHIKALRPELLGLAQGYDTFVARYCVTKFDRHRHEKIVGPNRDTASELRGRLASFIHRVKKKDVQKNMPPVVIDTWPVSLSDLAIPDILKREWETTESLLAHDIGKATGDEALALARSSPHAATQRRLTGLIKVQAMAAVLLPELDARRKVISFAFHHEVIDALADRFKNHGAVTLDGRTSPAKRIAVIKAFREDPKALLFNGQLTAAGEVIDLTPCSLMWIFEQDWVPKSLTQAIGRANRPGQVEPLTVWVLTLAGSIDDSLARTLIRKAKDIEALEPEPV